MTISYPAKFSTQPDGRVLVTFPDFAFGATDGKDLAEALIEAPDCLRAIVAAYMIDKRELPSPSRPKRGQRLIPVPLFLAPKVALYMAMRRLRMTNAELARRLKVRETIVRRLLDPHHESRAESLQTALAAVGLSTVLTVEDSAPPERSASRQSSPAVVVSRRRQLTGASAR